MRLRHFIPLLKNPNVVGRLAFCVAVFFHQPMSNAGDDIQFRRIEGGGAVLSNENIALRFSKKGGMSARLLSREGEGAGGISIFVPEGSAGAAAPRHVKVDGKLIPRFPGDRGFSVQPEDIETVHGKGKRIQVWGTAETPGGGKLMQKVTAEMYSRYPGTVLFRTHYTNVGNRPLRIDEVVENSWNLKAADLWAFHPGKWLPGHDLVFPVAPETDLPGDNIAWHLRAADRHGVPHRGLAHGYFGGGLPAISYMNPEMSLTIGYLSPHMKHLRFPLRHRGESVGIGIVRKLGEGAEENELPPGGEMALLDTFLALHRSDFYSGIRVMSRLHEDIGLKFRDPPIADVLAPAWSNRGSGSGWTKQGMRSRLPLLKNFGIKWIHMGDPWQDNLGDYGVSEKFKDPADLQNFVGSLHDEGFRVTAFYSDLVVDPRARVVTEKPDLFIRTREGIPMRASAFGELNFVLCPAYEPARRFVRETSEKLAGFYGFDGVKNDGHTVPLPCYHPDHHHEYPEQSVEQYHLMQKEVYEAFEKHKPEGFVVAYCFDGVVPYFIRITTRRVHGRMRTSSPKRSRA